MISQDDLSPSRAAGLARLHAFVPRAGRDYADGRNHDPGPGAASSVSRLSPYLRHRLITEAEVVAAVLAQHRFEIAEKFIQEVLWRTYWKGWLEMRPGLWQQYLAQRDAARDHVKGPALARAEAGATGIEGFDDWAHDLVATGYLHNHARMWFASIWIFTLRLPWALGADFFMRHLIDADPASNTLSWRWVAGLQTPGKTYLATTENIARFTDGRFAPRGLATAATAITEAPMPAPVPIVKPAPFDRALPTLLLVTPEDLNPESLFAIDTGFTAALVIGRTTGGGISDAFVRGAAVDTAHRVAAHFGCPASIADTANTAIVMAAIRDAGAVQVVAPYAPVGPAADAFAAVAVDLKVAGVCVARSMRSWDARFWPCAQKGFFPFKAQIPSILAVEGVG